MGLFRKNKTTHSSESVLTESEIQKKLYGDIAAQAPHVVIGDRDHFKETFAPQPPPKKSTPDSEPLGDLFLKPNEPLRNPIVTPPVEKRTVESSPRYVPLHDFESRTPAHPPAAADTDTSSSRFVYNRPAADKIASVISFAKNLLDPQNLLLRKIALWTGVLLVVFLLFLGVNVLNSQREVAMHTRYSAPVAAATKAVVKPAVVVERPVVVSPGPVKAKEIKKAEAPKSTSTPAAALPPKGSYVIQVVTYPTRQDADQIVGAFKKAGIRAYVKESARPSGRLFYLVLLRGGRTEEEAQAQLLKFKASDVARPFQDAFVKSSRS